MALALDLGTLNKRLKREGAQSGDITASLIWNDPSDLDLHAHVKLKGGKSHHIFYGNKKAANGELDVDMNASDTAEGFSLEPVENIYFKNPLGGNYQIEVINFTHRTDTSRWPGFPDDKRAVPFKVFLNQGGDMKEYSGELKKGGKVTAFSFPIAGSAGNYLVFPPEPTGCTFKDLCSKHKITWNVGCGYYAVARSEKIQAYKEMLLQNVSNDSFTVGSDECRKKLGWPAGELKKGPKDILANHRLFVQSTSYNRVIPPGTHVLFEVSADEYAAHRKANNTKFEHETHTLGKGASAKEKAKAKAKAKAEAKAEAKAGAKAKAKAKGKAAPEPRAGAKRAAEPKGRAKPKAKGRPRT